MYPVLFKLGPVTIYAYGVMMVVAFLGATWLAVRAARALPPERLAIGPEQLPDLTSWALLGGIAGGRLFYIGLHGSEFLAAPQELFAIWHGGLVWYGGLAGGLAAGWLYARGHGLDFLRVLDQCVPFMAFGHAIGRIGCFLNGCCYGRPTEAWCGILFPGHAEPVIPTQLFEAVGLFGLFLVLRWLQRIEAFGRRGVLLGIYLASYGALRFLLEFLRGDQARGAGGLTLQQLISLAIVAAGTAFLTSGWRTHGTDVRVPRRVGRGRAAP